MRSPTRCRLFPYGTDAVSTLERFIQYSNVIFVTFWRPGAAWEVLGLRLRFAPSQKTLVPLSVPQFRWCSGPGKPHYIVVYIYIYIYIYRKRERETAYYCLLPVACCLLPIAYVLWVVTFWHLSLHQRHVRDLRGRAGSCQRELRIAE